MRRKILVFVFMLSFLFWGVQTVDSYEDMNDYQSMTELHKRGLISDYYHNLAKLGIYDEFTVTVFGPGGIPYIGAQTGRQGGSLVTYSGGVAIKTKFFNPATEKWEIAQNNYLMNGRLVYATGSIIGPDGSILPGASSNITIFDDYGNAIAQIGVENKKGVPQALSHAQIMEIRRRILSGEARGVVYIRADGSLVNGPQAPADGDWEIRAAVVSAVFTTYDILKGEAWMEAKLSRFFGEANLTAKSFDFDNPVGLSVLQIGKEGDKTYLYVSLGADGRVGGGDDVKYEMQTDPNTGKFTGKIKIGGAWVDVTSAQLEASRRCFIQNQRQIAFQAGIAPGEEPLQLGLSLSSLFNDPDMLRGLLQYEGVVNDFFNRILTSPFANDTTHSWARWDEYMESWSTAQKKEFLGLLLDIAEAILGPDGRANSGDEPNTITVNYYPSIGLDFDGDGTVESDNNGGDTDGVRETKVKIVITITRGNSANFAYYAQDVTNPGIDSNGDGVLQNDEINWVGQTGVGQANSQYLWYGSGQPVTVDPEANQKRLYVDFVWENNFSLRLDARRADDDRPNTQNEWSHVRHIRVYQFTTAFDVGFDEGQQNLAPIAGAFYVASVRVTGHFRPVTAINPDQTTLLGPITTNLKWDQIVANTMWGDPAVTGSVVGLNYDEQGNVIGALLQALVYTNELRETYIDYQFWLSLSREDKADILTHISQHNGTLKFFNEDGESALVVTVALALEGDEREEAVVLLTKENGTDTLITLYGISANQILGPGDEIEVLGLGQGPFESHPFEGA